MAVLLTDRTLRATLVKGRSLYGDIDRWRSGSHRVIAFSWPLVSIDAVAIDPSARKDRARPSLEAFGLYAEGGLLRAFPFAQLMVGAASVAGENWRPPFFSRTNKSEAFLSAVTEAVARAHLASEDQMRVTRARSVLAGERRQESGMDIAHFMDWSQLTAAESRSSATTTGSEETAQMASAAVGPETAALAAPESDPTLELTCAKCGARGAPGTDSDDFERTAALPGESWFICKWCRTVLRALEGDRTEIVPVDEWARRGDA